MGASYLTMRGQKHVPKPMTGPDLDGRVGGEEVRHDDIGCAGEVCAQHHDHGCRLRKIVEHFESDANFIRNAFQAADYSKWLRNEPIQGFGRVIGQMRPAAEKTIANCRESAHASTMSAKPHDFVRRFTGLPA